MSEDMLSRVDNLGVEYAEDGKVIELWSGNSLETVGAEFMEGYFRLYSSDNLRHDTARNRRKLKAMRRKPADMKQAGNPGGLTHNRNLVQQTAFKGRPAPYHLCLAQNPPPDAAGK